MSRSLENLALHKEVLVARASLQRLRIAHELGALREEMRLPRLARSVTASPRLRAAFFTLLIMVAGRGRVARWVRGAALAVSVAGLASAIVRRSRGAD